MKYLITGGAGYIGSTICSALEDSGHTPIILDSLVTGRAEFTRNRIFYHADIADSEAVETIFREHPDIRATIHCAALIVIPESVSQPFDYYHENVCKSLELFKNLNRLGGKRVVFSSSATVYGDPASVPIREDFPVGATTNPYGRSKLIIEQVLGDLAASDPDWRIALLRYFNPVGAHKSGRIGEDPRGIPNNLMPYIAQVAVGLRAYLNVWGNDYPTPDGTGVRDYIHVMDLAAGHLAALDFLTTHPHGRYVFNLGTGQGYSVMEMLRAFETVVGKPLPFHIAPRRAGDVASCYANPGFAASQLNWRAKLDLKAMCESTWQFQQRAARG